MVFVGFNWQVAKQVEFLSNGSKTVWCCFSRHESEVVPALGAPAITKLGAYLCHLAVPVGNHSMPSLLHLASSGPRSPIMGFSLNSPVFINASKPSGLQPVSFNRRWWALLCEKPNSDGYQQERSCVPLFDCWHCFRGWTEGEDWQSENEALPSPCEAMQKKNIMLTASRIETTEIS
jgi:hypothetical protein